MTTDLRRLMADVTVHAPGGRSPRVMSWMLSPVVVLLLPYITFLENRAGGRNWSEMETAVFEALSNRCGDLLSPRSSLSAAGGDIGGVCVCVRVCVGGGGSISAQLSDQPTA